MSNSSNKFKVAAAQLSPVFLNKEETVSKVCDAVMEAGKNGAKFVPRFWRDYLPITQASYQPDIIRRNIG